jgi:hypothetical protein
MPERSRPVTASPARNDAAWPELTHLLASAAGCECQMMALSLAERDVVLAPVVQPPKN